MNSRIECLLLCGAFFPQFLLPAQLLTAVAFFFTEDAYKSTVFCIIIYTKANSFLYLYHIIAFFMRYKLTICPYMPQIYDFLTFLNKLPMVFFIT